MDPVSFQEYIQPGLLVLIPVLYLIGSVVKGSTGIDNRHIPTILTIVGIVMCTIYLFATAVYNTSQDIAMLVFTAVVQGVLCAGASVLANQLVKQNTPAG